VRRWLARWQLRLIATLLAFYAFSIMVGCAMSKTAADSEASLEGDSTDSGKTNSDADPNPDRKIGSMVRAGEHESALAVAESLITRGSAREQLVGTYWKVICFTHLNRLDSAMALLRKHQGRWGGVMRETSAETLLRALEGKEVPVRADPSHSPDKALWVRAESLEKRTAELQNEIERLQVENTRYEKLLRELDRLP
jgi:hypothetical protein